MATALVEIPSVASVPEPCRGIETTILSEVDEKVAIKVPPLSSLLDDSTIDTDPVLYYKSLLPHLTLEEKVGLLSGTSFTSTAGVERLGIPSLKVSDSINGVRGSASHLEDQGTACFPSSTCLASTWNKDLMRRFGERVGVEAKHKSVQVVIGPNVNLHRDPRGGRNFETFSEDPLLTGQLGAAIVNGIQSTGVGACAKHFVANESETLRRSYDVAESSDSRHLRELYMSAFQHLLRDSNPASIMMAYNKVQGDFCSENRALIGEVLRGAWGYDGCVMSDWYGTHSGPAALKAGLDLEMPGPSVFRGAKLIRDYQEGLVQMEEIDRAALQVLGLIGSTAASHSREPERTVVSEETSGMALRLAREGIVMVKNSRGTLPLDMRRAPRIAVIGNAADKPSVTGGGSAAAHPQYVQRPLDCLKKAHPLPELVSFARGVNPHWAVPTAPMDILKTPCGKRGVQIEYFNLPGDGSKDGVTPILTEISSNAPLVAMLGYFKPGLNKDKFSFVIKTQLTPTKSGMHTLGAQLTGAFELYVNDEEVLRGDEPQISVEDYLFAPKLLERITKVSMEAGREYAIRLVVHSRQFNPGTGEPPVNAAKLCFEEEFSDAAAISEAMQIGAAADVSIIFGGRTHEHESEGFDLETLKLPDSQVRMIKSVAAVSRRSILILHGGNPIDVSDFIDDVDAVLVAHFTGQEGGQAITDIISGIVNPSGRLATSWPWRLDRECVPSFGNFPATRNQDNGPVIRYEEGLQMGYRHSEAGQMYRYPFGFGLSFSTFSYSGLQVEPLSNQKSDLDVPYSEQSITVNVTVRNDGVFPGHEVVQLYSLPPQSPSSKPTDALWRPKRELKGFTKVFLAPGQTSSVSLQVYKRDISGVWDETSKNWCSIPGPYGLVVGDCCTAVYLDEENTWIGI